MCLHAPAGMVREITHPTSQQLAPATQRFRKPLAKQSSPVILVTNEVGGGIVPENAVARRFRDAAGLTNQRVAAAADEVWLVVSGCPLKVKPQ